MKALIKFSLKRKLLNPMMIFMMCTMFIIFGALLFSDHLTTLLLPNLFSQTKVNMPNEMAPYFNFEDTKYYKVDHPEHANIVIVEADGMYHVSVDQTINKQDRQNVLLWIEIYHRTHHYQFISEDLMESIDFILFPNVYFESEIITKGESGFVVITMIYFIMLGFSSTVASEVVSEKTTNMLEMMLTSISYKEHFMGKIIIGWITVFSQMAIWCSMFLFWLVGRFIYDQGEGLYRFMFKIGLNPENHASFIKHAQVLLGDSEVIILTLLSLVFLMIGILFVQLILLCISIKIENIEESASVQAPFYLIMLLLYYGTLAINSYQHMQLGIGKYLSYVPGISMLLMPLRIFYYELHWSETVFSITLASLFLYGGYHIGFRYYYRELTSKKSA